MKGFQVLENKLVPESAPGVSLSLSLCGYQFHNSTEIRFLIKRLNLFYRHQYMSNSFSQIKFKLRKETNSELADSSIKVESNFLYKC